MALPPVRVSPADVRDEGMPALAAAVSHPIDRTQGWDAVSSCRAKSELAMHRRNAATRTADD
jgi:hypothetical protein